MVGIEYEKEPALTVTGENEHWSYILDQTELETSKNSVLKILFCEPEEVIRLVRRMGHQAYWNGAETVFVEAPEACGLNGAETYGFYRLVQAENGRWRAVSRGAGKLDAILLIYGEKSDKIAVGKKSETGGTGICTMWI